MGITREKDRRRGTERIVARKTWPDGTRIRRYVPTVKAGKELLTRIESSILSGSWRDLRDSLDKASPTEIRTVSDLCSRYMAEYVAHRNRNQRSKRFALAAFCSRFGTLRPRALRRSDIEQYAALRDSEGLKRSSLNVNLAILRHLFNWAVEAGHLETSPMAKFRSPKAESSSLHIPTPDDVRRLVETARSLDHGFGAFVLVLSETALRRTRRRCGLETVRLHDLRHYRATRWISGGMDIRTCQELLGHSKIDMTLRYTHYVPRRAAEMVRAICSAEQSEADGLQMVRTS